MGVIEDLADDLARDTIAAVDRTGDQSLIEQVGRVLMSTSSTMQEAFMTSVKVRLAERRARKFLEDRLSQATAGPATAPQAGTIPPGAAMPASAANSP